MVDFCAVKLRDVECRSNIKDLRNITEIFIASHSFVKKAHVGVRLANNFENLAAAWHGDEGHLC